MTPRPAPNYKPVRIVTIGGGTGLSMLLRELKQHVARHKHKDEQRPIADLAAVADVPFRC